MARRQRVVEAPQEPAQSTLEIPVIELISQGGRFRVADFDDPTEEAAPASRPGPARPVDATQIIYQTPRGNVRQVGTGAGREFIITRVLDDGRIEEQPFRSELVDERVRDVYGDTRDEPAYAEPVADETYFDYEGDVHKVIDVEGIGPVFAQRLNDHGVLTTARVRYEPVDVLAQWTGAAPGTVAQWQVMSELMAINGVGPQYAEAMARSGIAGIAELQQRKAADIASQVQRYLNGLNQTVLGNEVTAKRVKGWQNAAKKMRKVAQSVPAE